MGGDRLTDLEQEAWARFLLIHDRIWRQLGVRLAEINVSMSEYDVLSMLRQAGADGMRMSDVAEGRLMSSGGFTRLADRLERQGLIERQQSSVDKRSYQAFLTEHGESVLEKARDHHLNDVRELFFNHLTDRHLHNLIDVWNQLDETDDTNSARRWQLARQESRQLPDTS